MAGYTQRKNYRKRNSYKLVLEAIKTTRDTSLASVCDFVWEAVNTKVTAWGRANPGQIQCYLTRIGLETTYDVKLEIARVLHDNPELKEAI